MPFTSAKMGFSDVFYRYYRFHITASQGLGLFVTIGKIQMFRRGNEGENIMTPTAQTWSSSNNLGSVASSVLNMGAPSTTWSSALLGGMPQWIELDAGMEIALNGFTISPSTNILNLGDAPKSFILKGSNDRVTYTDIKTYNVVWSSVGSQTFTTV